MKALPALLVLLALAPATATAQLEDLPYVAVFFDDDYTETGGYCPSDPPGSVITNLYVVALNFNEWINAIEFQIDYPPELLWLGDTPTTPLSIGTSPTGVALAWHLPQNGLEPILLMTPAVLWLCGGCSSSYNAPICPRGYPSSGYIRAVRWPDGALIYATNRLSLICPIGLPFPECDSPPVPVAETSWGQIKSLYR